MEGKVLMDGVKKSVKEGIRRPAFQGKTCKVGGAQSGLEGRFV